MIIRLVVFERQREQALSIMSTFKALDGTATSLSRAAAQASRFIVANAPSAGPLVLWAAS